MPLFSINGCWILYHNYLKKINIFSSFIKFFQVCFWVLVHIRRTKSSTVKSRLSKLEGKVKHQVGFCLLQMAMRIEKQFLYLTTAKAICDWTQRKVRRRGDISLQNERETLVQTKEKSLTNTRKKMIRCQHGYHVYFSERHVRIGTA